MKTRDILLFIALPVLLLLVLLGLGIEHWKAGLACLALQALSYQLAEWLW